jgi:hypothetical protein
MRARVSGTAELISLEKETIGDAIRYRCRLGFSAQDALVFASVIRDLKLRRDSAVFVTQNKKDFADPDVEKLLKRYRCRLFTDFKLLVAHIKGTLGIR